MEIQESYRDSLGLLNNTSIFSENLVREIVENCCSVLSGKTQNSERIFLKSDIEIQEVHAALLYTFAEFIRNNQTKEDYSIFLRNQCNLRNDLVDEIEHYYGKWNGLIRIQLLNIANHLPHVTDLKWKIDHVVKSNSEETSAGLLYRITLNTETFDEHLQKMVTKALEFSCTSEELQDLVYKLKESVRHLQKLRADN